MRTKRERRMLGVKFTPEFLEIILKKGKVEITKTPIPNDAEYQSTHYDYERDVFIAYFYHDSFDLLAEEQCIPWVGTYSFEYRRFK